MRLLAFRKRLDKVEEKGEIYGAGKDRTACIFISMQRA